MASIHLKRFQFCLSSVQACRHLLILRKPLNYLSEEAVQLRSWCCGSSTFWTVHSVVRCQHLFCRNYHAEPWNNPNSIAGNAHLHRDPGNGSKSDNKWMDEERFMKELDSFSSYKQIFKFVSSLEAMSDAMVAAALKKVCQIEVKDSELKNPKEVLENDVFRALCFQLEQQPRKLSDSGLLSALRALTKLHVDPLSTLIVRLVSESQERLHMGQLTIRNLYILGESLTNLEKWSPEEVAVVYRMLQMGVGEGGQYQDLLNKMNSFAVTIAFSLRPKLTSVILNALVVLDQIQARPLIIRLCRHSVRHIPHFTEEELVHVLKAFIRFGHGDQFFTKALERHVVKSFMQYCSQNNILSKPIFDVVAESFVYNADNFTTSQTAEPIAPFGKLNYLPPNAPSLFRKLEKIINARYIQFHPHVLLDLLHSCILIGRYPINFLARMFHPYFLQKLQGLDRFVHAQLTQLFLTVALECPSYKGPSLLPEYQVNFFLTPRQSLESSVDYLLYKKVERGLIDLLGRKKYFASCVLTLYGYMLDVEIKLDEEGFVLPAIQYENVMALCIDDQRRFCINSHNLLGKEAIKQGHLKLVGYEVVQIPFFEFDTLKSRNYIKEYLHKKIFTRTSSVGDTVYNADWPAVPTDTKLKYWRQTNVLFLN
uniref:FAST kinase domains 3 n=1 Tax=Sphenodon punctatus TaxID=8508 RepID=A0A8D0G5X6_SPHPU